MSLFNTGIRPAIDQHLLNLSKERRSDGEYWSASSAGYCMRKNIFERLKVPHSTPDDPRKQRVFSAGHIFHDWIQELTRDAGISIAQEVELQDEDLMIRGHFDDLILLPSTSAVRGPDETVSNPPEAEVVGSIPTSGGHLILYDYKTVNSRSFMWAKKNDNAMSHYHRLQLGTYMYMLRNNSHGIGNDGARVQIGNTYLDTVSEARILKIEKDALMMMEQQLMWSPELESEVLNYWKTLNAHWEKKTLPKCTCHVNDNGFMSREKFNPFYYGGEPCSLKWYEKSKAEGLLKEIK